MKKVGLDGMKKRGQITIFIIIAILIVSAVAIFFLWAQPKYFSDVGGVKGFENCIGDVLEERVAEIEGTAGIINPIFTYSYMGEKLPYLCYTSEYYVPCTVQVPFLWKVFDESLEKLIREDVDICYEKSVDDLRAQGYDVSSGDVTYNVILKSGKILVEIDAPTSVGGGEFSRFDIEKSSPIYDMIMIVTSLVQSETAYGDTDVSTIMLYYPDYYIEKIKRGDGTKVYAVENKVYGNKLKFASRSLVFPAGHAIK